MTHEPSTRNAYGQRPEGDGTWTPQFQPGSDYPAGYMTVRDLRKSLKSHDPDAVVVETIHTTGVLAGSISRPVQHVRKHGSEVELYAGQL